MKANDKLMWRTNYYLKWFGAKHIMALTGLTLKDLKKLRENDIIRYKDRNADEPNIRAEYRYHITDVMDYMDSVGIDPRIELTIKTDKGKVNLSTHRVE